jgi:surface antigen
MAEFIPRLTVDGIYLSKYYYAENPFYQSGYGLPNCTCYAWGRFYEISAVYPTNLPLGNGGQWFPSAVLQGYYVTGETPSLGAVACYSSISGGDGHVAIVEQINEDGSFIISQSGYYRPIAPYPPDTTSYFWTDLCDANTKKAPWMTDYSFQGFIYNPEQPIPPTPSGSRKKMPVWMYLRYF